ncbi:SAM-dependent methyltransferase [Kribbella sp. NPDC056861]|uniref:SAM-dependent methyltransferase n=1 Tax=Kribbella sp. NPDC056861 TaxID=3154857 RepID=UPI003436D734
MSEDGIAAGVGRTALLLASARAMETGRSGLVDDRFARLFVLAAGAPSGLPVELPAEETGTRQFWHDFALGAGLRSRFFDDFLLAHDGGQIVLVAAGLDSRSYRLNWSAGTKVFEIDQPAVLAFKGHVLADEWAACTRCVVPVDLREDWAGVLQRSGFQPGEPTAWLLEGLMPYLSPTDVETLLDRITNLSAPGSSIALNHFSGIRSAPPLADALDFDVLALLQVEDQPDPAELLHRRGWSVTRSPSRDIAALYDCEQSWRKKRLDVIGTGVTGTK